MDMPKGFPLLSGKVFFHRCNNAKSRQLVYLQPWIGLLLLEWAWFSYHLERRFR